MFRNALDQPDLRSKSMGTALSAQEIKLVVDTFLFNNRNVETMLDRDVVPLLFSFIAKGKVTEKEKAFKSLLVISSKSSRGKGQIISHLRTNYGKPGIQEAAKRLGLEQKRPQTTEGNLLFYTFLKVLDSKIVRKNHLFLYCIPGTSTMYEHMWHPYKIFAYPLYGKESTRYGMP